MTDTDDLRAVKMNQNGKVVGWTAMQTSLTLE